MSDSYPHPFFGKLFSPRFQGSQPSSSILLISGNRQLTSLHTLKAHTFVGRLELVIGEESYREHSCRRAAPSIQRRGKVDPPPPSSNPILNIFGGISDPSFTPSFCLTTISVHPTFINPRLFARYLLMPGLQRLSIIIMYKTN